MPPAVRRIIAIAAICSLALWIWLPAGIVITGTALTLEAMVRPTLRPWAVFALGFAAFFVLTRVETADIGAPANWLSEQLVGALHVIGGICFVAATATAVRLLERLPVKPPAPLSRASRRLNAVSGALGDKIGRADALWRRINERPAGRWAIRLATAVMCVGAAMLVAADMF
jgi:hypothetical protein